MPLKHMYDMLVLHDPENNQQGDCLRACIATLLQEDPKTVPHFMQDPERPNWLHGVNVFLAQYGLWYVQVPNTRMYWHSTAGDVYHVLSGKTKRGTLHAVVALNGKMIHDPHPSRDGLVTDDPQWNSDLSVGLLVARNNNEWLFSSRTS